MNAVLREPFAGFQPGKKDLLTLPRVQLKTNVVKSLLGRILAATKNIVDRSVLINQWKVLKILDRMQSRLRFFESTGRVFASPEEAADFFATDQVLLERTLELRDQWQYATAEGDQFAASGKV